MRRSIDKLPVQWTVSCYSGGSAGSCPGGAGLPPPGPGREWTSTSGTRPARGTWPPPSRSRISPGGGE